MERILAQITFIAPSTTNAADRENIRDRVCQAAEIYLQEGHSWIDENMDVEIRDTGEEFVIAMISTAGGGAD